MLIHLALLEARAPTHEQTFWVRIRATVPGTGGQGSLDSLGNNKKGWSATPRLIVTRGWRTAT